MQDLGVQDLVTMLLHNAIQTSHALDRIHHLAALNADSDPAATATLADAITLTSQAGTSLLHSADQLTDKPPPQH